MVLVVHFAPFCTILHHFTPFYTIKNHNLGLSRGRAREDKHCMLTDAEFVKMLEDCRENGGVNDGILRAVESVVREILGIYHSDLSAVDKDDVAQSVLVRFWRNWARIAPNRNPVAFIGYMVKTEAFRVRRKFCKRKKFLDYDSEISKDGERGTIDRFAKFDRTQKLPLGIIRAGGC